MKDINDKKYYSKQITARFLEAMDSIISNRESGKVTAKAFGDTVGISSSNLNRLKDNTGENAVTVEAIARLCDHYKISAYWLVTGKGEMFDNDQLTSASKSVHKRVGDIEDSVKQIEGAIKIMKKIYKDQ